MNAVAAELATIEQPSIDTLAGAVPVVDSYNIAHPKKRAFLATYAQVGNIRHACLAVGIARRTHYDWLETDPAYKAAFEQAGEDAADALEAEARRRAFEGSDTLLIFLLKGLRPERYRERYDHRLHGGDDAVLGPMRMPGIRTLTGVTYPDEHVVG